MTTLRAPFDLSTINPPRYYTAHNLVIDRQERKVIAEFKYQCDKATAINAAKYADEMNTREQTT